MKSNCRNFLADASNQEKAFVSPQPIISQHPEPEKIKHILIGSKEAVIATIEVLNKLGYANVRDWTPLLPTSNPGEVTSVLVRSIKAQQ
ncbi:hypothetical protein NIES267_42070 [Calothrix parasitica NIES-267]|uniref:Uncharacterized protein n=1 Tax=Calothrix parasitica NIES-267 TaxID=1973488 RepID=A0A1Z4LU72_9CYAN|nr:hypothetical protein NIES267_42070 [Calothrix parasitica NIES-267]